MFRQGLLKQNISLLQPRDFLKSTLIEEIEDKTFYWEGHAVSRHFYVVPGSMGTGILPFSVNIANLSSFTGVSSGA